MQRKLPRNNYYSLAVQERQADLIIYGNITSWPWKESDVSSYTLSRQLADLGDDVDTINVNINSYGGDVEEGIAIYNALKRHPAQVVTRCDGMAASISSVIFMAGDQRIMYETSMLMIHNASMSAWGTGSQLRKAADDIDKITTQSKAAYLADVNIAEEELCALMDSESLLSPSEALEMGFATSIEGAGSNGPTQSAGRAIFNLLASAKQSKGGGGDSDDDDSEAADGEAGDDEGPDDESATDDHAEDRSGDDEKDAAKQKALASFLMSSNPF